MTYQGDPSFSWEARKVPKQLVVSSLKIVCIRIKGLNFWSLHLSLRKHLRSYNRGVALGNRVGPKHSYSSAWPDLLKSALKQRLFHFTESHRYLDIACQVHHYLYNTQTKAFSFLLEMPFLGASKWFAEFLTVLTRLHKQTRLHERNQTL